MVYCRPRAAVVKEDRGVHPFRPLHSLELTHNPHPADQLLRGGVVQGRGWVVVHAGRLDSDPDDLRRSTG